MLSTSALEAFRVGQVGSTPPANVCRRGNVCKTGSAQKRNFRKCVLSALTHKTTFDWSKRITNADLNTKVNEEPLNYGRLREGIILHPFFVYALALMSVLIDWP